MMKNKYLKEVGEFLRSNRVRSNITQAEISDYFGFSTAQYVSNVERGKCPPSVELMKGYIEVCGIKPESMALVVSKKYQEYLKREFV